MPLFLLASSKSLTSSLLPKPAACALRSIITPKSGIIPGCLIQRASMSKDAALRSHYESHSSDSYEDAFFYEAGAYTDYLRGLVRSRLKLHNEMRRRRLLDIGGGTGNFTRLLFLSEDENNNNDLHNDDDNNNKLEAIVVDPFLEHAPSSSSDRLRFVREPAEAFLREAAPNDWWRKDVDQILFKEVVHHFSEEDRPKIFSGVYRDLNGCNGEHPSLLIITRPQTDIDYPLWPEARKVWAANQPSLEEFTRDLEQAGFSNIRHSLEAYPCRIKLDRWQGMVKNRFWSTFSNFSDRELEEACETIAGDYNKSRTGDSDNSGVLRFEDRLLFISAEKI